jgi:hypothetical protein
MKTKLTPDQIDALNRVDMLIEYVRMEIDSDTLPSPGLDGLLLDLRMIPDALRETLSRRQPRARETEEAPMIERYRGGRRLWNADEDATLRATYPHESTEAIAARIGRPLSAVGLCPRATSSDCTESAANFSRVLRRVALNGAAGNRNAAFRREGPRSGKQGAASSGLGSGAHARQTQFKRGERQGVAVKLWKPIGTERIS